MPPREAFAIVCALFLLTAVPVGLAQEDDGTPYDKTVDTEDDRVTIEVTQTGEERENTITHTFETDNATLSVEALTEAPPDDEDEDSEEPQMRIQVQLHQVLEYDDVDQDDRYTVDDTAASSWNASEGSEVHTGESPNGTLQWQALEEENITSDDGVTGWHIEGKARFPVESNDTFMGDPADLIEEREGGNFTVHLYTFSHPAEFRGKTLQPTEVFVTVGFEDYPYEKNGTETAVIFETSGSDEVAEDAPTELSAEGEILGLGTELTTTWEEQATVDGGSAPVTTGYLDPAESEDGSSTGTTTSAVLVHSYPRAEEDLEHPHLQSASFEKDTGVLGEVEEVPAAGAPAAALAAGLVALAARRPRRSR